MKRFLAATALALAICAPIVAHADECDLACRDRKVEQSRGEPDWRTPVPNVSQREYLEQKYHLAKQRTRDDFINLFISDSRVSSALNRASEACNRNAETPYEVTMKNIDCKHALAAIQREAFFVSSEVYKTVRGREYDIVSELMNEVYNGGSWWLGVAE